MVKSTYTKSEIETFINDKLKEINKDLEEMLWRTDMKESITPASALEC